MHFDEKSTGYLTNENLRLLFRLRNIAIAAQSGTILLALVYLEMALPVLPIVSTVGFLALFNIYTRYRINQASPLLLSELVVQISVDILVLTILLSLSGGASNPFAILYLLPLTITAILLPAKVTWGVSFLTVICYSLLMVVYVPMPHAHNHSDAFNLHIVGMWLGFVLSAGVIAYFIVGLQRIINKQAIALNQAKEEAMKSEQLVKLGVLAASAAHDMGTPLNNMALLLEDLEYSNNPSSENEKQKIESIREQINRCRMALRDMSQSAGNISLKSGGEVSLSEYIKTLMSEWRKLHPNTTMKLNNSESGLVVMVDDVLNVALTNMVDNAVEASPEKIQIDVMGKENRWEMIIRDYGAGLTKQEQKSMGKKGFTTKPHGLGLGVFLSHSIVERLGGIVNIYNHPDGGLCTQIQIPNEFQQATI